LDLAFQRLGKAIEHRTNFVNLPAVEPVEPFFDPPRRDSQFPKLLGRNHYMAIVPWMHPDELPTMPTSRSVAS